MMPHSSTGTCTRTDGNYHNTSGRLLWKKRMCVLPCWVMMIMGAVLVVGQDQEEWQQQQQQQQHYEEPKPQHDEHKDGSTNSLVPEYHHDHHHHHHQKPNHPRHAGVLESWKRSIARITKITRGILPRSGIVDDASPPEDDPLAVSSSSSSSSVGQALHLQLLPQQESTILADKEDDDINNNSHNHKDTNLLDTKVRRKHNQNSAEDHSLSKLIAQNLDHRHAFLTQTSETTGRRIHHRMAHAAWNEDDDTTTSTNAAAAAAAAAKNNDNGEEDTSLELDEYGSLLIQDDHDDDDDHDNNGDQNHIHHDLFDFQYFHGKEYQDRASREFRHSFAGMKLHVFQNYHQHHDPKTSYHHNPHDTNHLPLATTTASTTTTTTTATPGTTRMNDKTRQTGHTNTDNGTGGNNDHSHFVFDSVYELMEPMHLELGIPPKHYSDYAYTPVYYYSSHENHHANEHPHSFPPHLLAGQGHVSSSIGSGDRFPSSRLSQQRVRPLPSSEHHRPYPHEQDRDPLTSIQISDPVTLPATATELSPEEYAEKETCVALMEGTDADADADSGGDEERCSKAIETDRQHTDTQDTWWKWWFSFNNPWWGNNGDAKQSAYTMGHTAFAGGSHGQVWRGRRVCDYYHRGKMREETEFSFEEHVDCDEDRPLILKRLKVEQGYRLLEAGLREIYFGQWIQKGLVEDSEKDLFTTYVDHFFRELPRAAVFGSPPTTDLELWIVFEDAGPSLRNYMYAPVASPGGFVMYQHSPLWTQLRMSNSRAQAGNSESHQDRRKTSDDVSTFGRQILRNVLQQILSAAAVLHENGIVHRDIKPSNVMCLADLPLDDLYALDRLPHIQCRLGDFSSGWDLYTDENLYTKGPSPGEQTDEYAPPEAYIDPHWVPFDKRRPQSYDSWSIGVVALELLLGTPNVFSVDQRTTVLLTSKMKREGASDEELQRALYLAALSQFCIYVPNSTNKQHQASWPYRHGDPLHKTAMAKDSCTLQDFHRALRARDPLGMGFDSSTDLLLHLIWQLVAWDPMERITAAEALQHPFFLSPDGTLDSLEFVPGRHNALESQMLDPRLDFLVDDNVQEFICPKCGRVFSDWRSCIRHATTRKHAKFCTYDRRTLPTCINTHSMLPAHPTSGYCDLQGRRLTIEDFHSIHLYTEIQFYGIFDGHTGNVASKYAASTLFDRLIKYLPGLQEGFFRHEGSDLDWKVAVETNVSMAFQETHEGFLEALALAPTMDQSGTTATALLVTDDVIVLSSLGDSRAVLSSTDQDGNLSAIQLTNDHVASDPQERAMVLERGGSVSSSLGGLDRVNGTLAITRSIGDAALAPMLSRKPHVTSMKRGEIQELCGEVRQCFVVLASDGLWDVMSNQEAVEMVAEVVAAYRYDEDSTDRVSWNNGGAFQEAAEVLAVDAFVRGSTDNIGVCVVALVE